MCRKIMKSLMVAGAFVLTLTGGSYALAESRDTKDKSWSFYSDDGYGIRMRFDTAVYTKAANKGVWSPDATHDYTVAGN